MEQSTDRRRGFAVIDFETTGLSPARGSRAIEIAVVLADRDGVVTGMHDTLIDAGPVVGPTRSHRISARETAQAPAFRGIAPRLVELLSGRVVVEHNAVILRRETLESVPVHPGDSFELVHFVGGG